LPKQPDRNWTALRELYKLLVASPNWRVHVVTHVPTDRTDATVLEDFDRLQLPRPDSFVILRGAEEKGSIFQRLKADLVFEDNDRWLAQALESGAMALKVI